MPRTTGASFDWKYYRLGNTGVIGDCNDALWIAPDDTPYICCYDPHFEEGGLSMFIESENRWENVSNVHLDTDLGTERQRMTLLR